nr:hypothetical protein [uncultured Noviherbaspirillum sp.]
MKNLMRSTLTLTVVATALSACGGGGSDNSGSTDASGNAATPSMAQMAGTYIMPCKGTTFPPSADSTLPRSESETSTIIISGDAATGKATISAQHRTFLNSSTCEEAALNFDLTFHGTASDKPGRKTYTSAAGKPVTASIATVTYTGLRFSKGNLTFKLPMPGATIDKAYVLDNNVLYLSKGRRGADGLGDAMTPGAVRQ